MDIDFTQLGYLLKGNDRQKKVYELLYKNKVFEILKEFSPILVGTVPIGIDLPESDLDILCQFEVQDEFIRFVRFHFENKPQFKLKVQSTYEFPTVVVNFILEDVQIEIFGQTLPTNQQNGYLHMLVEHKLLQENGSKFKERIIDLKRKGLKTEPAFAKVLGLSGDPFRAILNLAK